MRLPRRPLLVLGAACTLVVSLSGQTVRVLSVSGEATLQAPGESAPRPVQKGDTIIVGTRIITGPAARVILTPLPGVNSIIAPDSEVVIERASVTPPEGDRAARHSAVLDLRTGAVTTDLRREENVELDYGVRTARGLAGARGTTYTVGINTAGIQTIVVADGVISLLLADGRSISLVPGQVSITRPDGGTETVLRASELSTGDQALADNWVETTLDGLAEAVEQGIDIDPAALDDAVRAATGLGVDIAPATQNRLERARDRLLERREARLEQGSRLSEGDGNRPPISELQGTAGFDLLAFLATLPPERRAAFALLPAPARRDLGDYLGRLAETEARVAAINYALDLEPTEQLPVFLNRDDAVRDLLVARSEDPALQQFAYQRVGEENRARPAIAVRYYATLPPPQRGSYESLDLDLQVALAASTDPRLAEYALGGTEGQTRPREQIRFLIGLPAARRDAYLALPDQQQSDLATAADPALTTYVLAPGRGPTEATYALALTLAQRSLYLGFPPLVQLALAAAPTDGGLQTFAYAVNQQGGNLNSHATILLFAGLGEVDRETYLTRPINLRELATTDPVFRERLLRSDPITRSPVFTTATLEHSLTLPTVTVAAYLVRAPDVRDLLAALGKPALTTALLDGRAFEQPPTDGDLRRNIGALLALAPENLALFETFAGGPTYPRLEATPGPFDHGDQAWTRTRNHWQALSDTARARVLALGAAEGLFDYGADFITSALQDYDTSLTLTQRAAALEAGWGRFFADYFAEEGIRPLLASGPTFTPAALAVIKQFRISPYAFGSFGNGSPETPTDSPGGFDPRARLAALTALDPAQRALLRRLLGGDEIIRLNNSGYIDANDNFVLPTYEQTLANALAFAQDLGPDLDAIAALGLGEHLFRGPADATFLVGQTRSNARDRLLFLLDLFRTLDSEQREIALDHRIFAKLSLGDPSLDTGTLQSTLATLASLSPLTRDFLAHIADELPTYDLINGGEFSGYYPISAIDTLLSGLNPTEFQTLIELDPGDSLLKGNPGDGRLIELGTLKSVLGAIASLDDTQRSTLNELGITSRGGSRRGLFASDQEGLARLLQAYSELPGALRVATRQLRPFESAFREHVGRSFFFADDDGFDQTIQNVSFNSPGDLHVGAVRRLSLFSDSFSQATTFSVPAGRDIFLRASTLVDLEGVTFANGVRAITIEAATLNLANLDFPEGSVIALNSKLGGLGSASRYPNFDGSSQIGRVNFLRDVSYGGVNNVMFDQASFDLRSRGNITIGTLQNPATPPTYTPPPNP